MDNTFYINCTKKAVLTNWRDSLINVICIYTNAITHHRIGCLLTIRPGN